MVIVKLDADGQEVLRYSAEKYPPHPPNGIALTAIFQHNPVVTPYTTFNRGDHLHEYFFSDRWYNIFALYVADTAELKGWYCNICRPAQITAETVSCADLALDLWITPTGDYQILDEDEFAALALTPDEKREALAALQALINLAQTGQLPR